MLLTDFVRIRCLTLAMTLAAASGHSHHHRHHHEHSKLLSGEIAVGLHSRAEEDGPWGAWTESSECSRTCGGGVSLQTRSCHDLRPDGSHSCIGPSKRFFSCNIQDCPEGSRDFREEQCSRFDSIPFDGKFYNWIPYRKSQNLCELNCMPKGEKFYYRHSQKVIDGTRCKDDAMDVCVDGSCMAVGCDMMLGSEVKEDACRECGGDGSSCKSVEGLFDLDNLQVGYNDIILIPAGATHIKIRERFPTNNYLAIRNLTGHYYLNGNWRIEFPRHLKFAGTTFIYERKPHGFVAPETIEALGPTTEPIFIVLLYQQKNQGILYEYSIPNGISKTQPDTYSWIFSNYGVCTRTCAGGYQLRNVSCVKTVDYELVADYLCDPNLKPTVNRSCNAEPCPAHWQVSEWGECSEDCGGGIQYRQVHCQQLVQGRSVLIGADEKCQENDGPKPPFIRVCNNNTCPTWHTGQWSNCDRMCGDGHQSREVTCHLESEGKAAEVVNSLMCDSSIKPASSQSCKVRPCEGTEWIVSQWSGCESICGLNMESRETHCASENGSIFPSDMCYGKAPPALTKPCLSSTPCEAMWHASEWSECSAECGSGIRTRFVMCGVWQRNMIEQVSEEKCSLSKKFHSMEKCNKEPCKGMWFTGPWNRCSVPCGGGHRTRKVMCLLENKVVSNSDCGAGFQPFDREPCNLHPCDEDEVMMVGGCHKSKYGCCPDGVTHSGPDYDGCPPESRSDKECEKTEFGCCLDGLTPAMGPFKKGCPKMTKCGETKYGCCPDGVTPAKGSGGEEGCDDDCVSSFWGCCPDNFTAALGDNFEGCDLLPTSGCHSSPFGCCPDGVTAAEGTEYLGCNMDEFSGEVDYCSFSEHGCCPDGINPAQGPGHKGCPETTTYTSLTVTSASECSATRYGCCPDGFSPAQGRNFHGCEALEGSGEPETCENTLFGCCPDQKTPAKGVRNEGCTCEHYPHGCCQDKFTPARGPNYDGCVCAIMLFGCCGDNRTPATGFNKEGCGCQSSLYGCCPDNSTASLGPNYHGCHCKTFFYGCCPDGKTAAVGPNNEGCPCHAMPYGCCPDGKTAAVGPNNEGCPCHTMPYGCCRDGKTAAVGPNNEGCSCHTMPYGCCPDGKTAAVGPNNEGCPCHTMPYGCCPDGKTAAIGPNNEGCPCHTMPYGCCPDGKTAAVGPNKEGCPCHAMPYGCCSDKETVARGPNDEGCPCHTRTHGCCPDMKTSASGPNNAGCPCHTMPYGCCPDGETVALGLKYEGCPCRIMPHGCCPDGEAIALGPNFQGCPCHVMPYGCCSDGQTTALGRNEHGCPCSVTRHGCCPDEQMAASGPNYEGCPCKTFPHGCCPDGKSHAKGDNYQGCHCTSFPYGCCPDGITVARGENFKGCNDVIETDLTFVSADVCSMPKQRGPCRNYTVKWFFDMTYGGCSRFWYGGCDGNGNQFDRQEECEKVCVSPEGADACLLPKVVGPCEGSYPSFYYNANSDTCESFTYSGCLGNNNRFVSKELCEQTCIHQEALDECEQPMAAGPCSGIHPRWFFDKNEGHCKQFIYGGCEGNDNNFESEKQCIKNCGSFSERDICIMPKVEGPCLGNFPRYYYDYMDGHCKKFIYSGCQGNKNRFVSIEQCERICNSTKISVSTDICTLPKEEGPCKAAIVHWFYSSKSSRCEQFYYGGCDGNANRFETRSDCERACLSSSEPDICRQPQEIGNCYLFRERWFYDLNEERCRRFYYSGCGGNKNNFASYTECEKHCGKPSVTEIPDEEFKIEFCFLESDVGPCKGKESRWFYNRQNGVCEEFYYGGCRGNGNRFRTKKECQSKCAASQDICKLPKVRGPCSGSFIQWYYDEHSNLCHEFHYSGCQGNPNRFHDKETCELHCKKETSKTDVSLSGSNNICSLPKDPGPCLGYFPRWHYDPIGNECRSFVYGGCRGNKNRFETHQDCEVKCHNSSVPKIRKGKEITVPAPASVVYVPNEDICRQPMDKGHCPDAQNRWYYDPQTLTCLQFVYKGCGGNKNRFKTYELCMRFCSGVHAIPQDAAVDETPSTQANACPTSNCVQLQCPYGVEEVRDLKGCISCLCSNPCENYNCPNATQCVVEMYRTAAGEPRPQPICRLMVKKGECSPSTDDVPSEACHDRCQTDADCAGELKCCFVNCARICQQPHFPESQIEVNKKDAENSAPPASPPQILATPKDVSVKIGSPVLLRCIAKGNPAPQVTWTRNGRLLTSNKGEYKVSLDGSLHIMTVGQTDAGIYTCTAENGIGRPALRFFNLIVYDDVTTEISLATKNYKTGSPLQLDCVVQGIPTPKVSWHLGNGSKPLHSNEHRQILRNHTLYIASAQYNDSGAYLCAAENEHGKSSASISITVHDVFIPPSCTDSPYFANCALIVKAQYCINPTYAKFCCLSCAVSGQLQRISDSAS